MLRKAVSVEMLILLLTSMLTLAFNIQPVKAEPVEIIIDTEVEESRFTTYPPRQSPYYWVHVQDHDTFRTRAYGGNFWYTLCGAEGTEEPLYYGQWQASLPYSGLYEVYVWIPNPDPFEYGGRVYTPTQSAIYQVYHKDGMSVKTVNQRLRTGGWYSVGSFTFGTSASVILNDRTGEPYLSTMIAFDAIKFVHVNNPPTLSNGYVTPSSGDTSTVFEYYVTYADPDGDAPTTKYVYIDSSPYTMTKISGDYVSGATFKYSTTLAAGSHNYYFYFDDGHGHTVRLPTSGTYSGPNVSPPPPSFDFALGISPSSGSVQQGGSVSATVTVTLTSGSTQTVTLTTSGLPSGAYATFNPSSGYPTFTSTCTISTSATTPTGTFYITIIGSGGGLTRTTTYTLTVTPLLVPDFSISASPTSLTVQQGSSGTSTITITSINGFNQAVQLSVSGAPSGVTATLSPSQVTPPAGGTTTSTLTVSVATTATTGSYTLTVTGTSGALTHSTYISLEITVPPPTYIQGIDVRDDINWVQVYNAGYRFAFVKATEGINWKKPGFEKRVDDAKEAGLFVGVYHFARPVPNRDKAKEEAESFVRLAGDHLQEGYLRPALDVEDSDDYGEYPEQLGKETLAQWIKTWMDTVKSMTGVEPILYMNAYLFQFLSDSPIVDQYDIWIPDLRDAEPSYGDSPNTRGWKTWAFWQYKQDVTLAGGTADLDVFNGDISKLQTFVIGSGDHIPPQVDAFDVNPRSITLGQSFMISYSVSDNVGLAWIELWRTVDSNGQPDGSRWEKLSTEYIFGTTYSGIFTHSPSSSGVYWFGIHVGDTAGNWVTEKVPISVTSCRLIITALSPVNLVVTDPDGLVVSKALNEILGASYMEFDVDGDGDLDDVVTILDRKLGNYSIMVIPEPEATPTDTFTLVVSTQTETIVLAENVAVSEIPSEPYIFESKPALYTFLIVWGEKPFVVSVESNSTVSNFAFNQPDKEISFNVTGEAGTIGFCNVTIPKALLYGEPWTVLIDGAPVPTTITENETHTSLYFTYTHSTHTIQISARAITGDINGDGTVDVFDAILLSTAFGSKPGDSNWNANADINGDGTVDVFDAIILATHFGEKHP